jgi:ABC-type transport system involved in multi-copper enzyme maturation permease subunit
MKRRSIMTSAKAWVAAITGAAFAGLSSLLVVLVGDMTLSELTQGQWVAVGISVLSSFGASFGFTWAVSNRPAGEHAAE